MHRLQRVVTDSILDSPATYARLDPEGLFGRIAALPDQIDAAWRVAQEIALPGMWGPFDSMAVLGMGGSAIGGALLRAIASGMPMAAPVEIVRGYALPSHVGIDTLVFASSNSGDTEETVAALTAAKHVGCHCVVIATGGRLLEIARKESMLALQYDWDAEPRSALGWSFAPLLALAGRFGLLPDLGHEIAAATVEMRAMVAALGRDVPEASNPAKQLARRLAGKLPVIVASDALAPVAYRWRTQINENAKSWAIAEELPEMNHNAPLGYGAPAAVVPTLHAVLLRHASMHPRNQRRVDLTVEQMRDAGVGAEVLEIAGSSVLAQMLCAIQFGDFASYYLGLLNGVHPSPMDALAWIKQRMAASG